VRDSTRRDSLLDAVRAELQMLTLRQDLAKAQLAEATRQLNAGMLSSADVGQANAEVQALQAQLMKLQLNLQEIQRAAQPPRDELNAPLVGGRDFVKERIDVDLSRAQQQLAAADARLQEVERRVRAGVESDVAQQLALADVARVQEMFGVLAERLALRREFIEKGTPAEQLAQRLEMAQLRASIRSTQQMLELAKAQADRARRLRAIGTISELDAMRAEVDVKERELALAQLNMQLKRLGGMAKAPQQ
jgi:outer membrane protein TolC